MTGARPHAELSPMESVNYAPMAPMAVVAMVVAVLAAVVVVGMSLAARNSGKPIFEPLLLILPIAGLIVSLFGSWQVRSSEGARSGRGISTGAFWLSMLTSVAFGGYLLAVDMAIRNQASEYTLEWFKSAATQPIETSFLLCLEPGQRQSLSNEKDLDGIRQRFSAELLTYGNNDIYRMIHRNGERADVKLHSVKEWTLKDGGYLVVQVFDYHCPEGRFELVIPAYGRDVPGAAGRMWQVNIRRAGLNARETTILGRILMDLQIDARRHVVDFARMLTTDSMHDAFLETLSLKQRSEPANKTETAAEVAFKNGSLLLVDGKKPTAEQLKTYNADIIKGRINVFPGSATNPVGAPQVVLTADGLQLVHHVEIGPADGTPVVAYITVQVEGDELVAEIVKEFNNQNWRQSPVQGDKPGLAEVDRFPKRGFRVVSIDVRPQEKRPTPPVRGQTM